MSARFVLGTTLAVATLLAGCGTAPNTLAARATTAGLTAQSVPGQILVGLKQGRNSQAIGPLVQKLGARTVKMVKPLNLQVLQVKGDTSAALAALKADPNVAYAELNAVESLPPMKREGGIIKGSSASRAGGDPMLADQWAMAKMNVPAAWDITQGDEKTILAIVDTGIDYNHPDLAGRVIKGHDFANNDDDPMDGHAHGTHCAGIAAASAGNGIGIAGVAPKVTLMAVKVLSDAGSGTTDAVCAGIVYAADKGASVISMSLGGRGGQAAKQDAVTYARSKGAVVVVAMGNDGGNVAVYPGANEGVIAIGATTIDDTRATFSNFGTWNTLAAPGHKILSTVPNNGYQAFSGTSMATPAAAGLAALVRSQNPKLDAEGVLAQMKRGAVDLGTPGFDNEFGHGRIDALATLKAIR